MDRSQAYQTLNLHPTADGQMVADAYWRLVRVAQGEGDSPDSHAAIERLNDAYATLAANVSARAQGQQASTVMAQPQAGSGFWLLDVVADWVAAQAQLTRERWPARNLEVGLLGGSALALMLLAIGAGASLLLTFGAALVAIVAIWAPWRRVR